MTQPGRRVDGRVDVPPGHVQGSVPAAPHHVGGLSSAPPQGLAGRAAVPPRHVGGIGGVPPQELVGMGGVPPRHISGVGVVPPQGVVGGAPLPPHHLVGRAAPVPGAISGNVRQPPAKIDGRALAPPAVVIGNVAIPVWRRVYDFILAAAVWINTWGQAYFQNQTPKFTGQPKELWERELTRDRAVAWQEIKNCWNAMWSGSYDHQADIDGPEADHAIEFVALVRKMSKQSRLLRKFDALQDENPNEVTPPLCDSALNWYTKKYFGIDALDPASDPFLLPRV